MSLQLLYRLEESTVVNTSQISCTTRCLYAFVINHFVIYKQSYTNEILIDIFCKTINHVVLFNNIRELLQKDRQNMSIKQIEDQYLIKRNKCRTYRNMIKRIYIVFVNLFT